MYVLTVSFYYFYLIILIIFQSCPQTLRTGLVHCTFLIVLYLCIKFDKISSSSFFKAILWTRKLTTHCQTTGWLLYLHFKLIQVRELFQLFQTHQKYFVSNEHIGNNFFWITCSISKLHILNFNSIYLHKSLTLLLGIALSFWNLWASNL